MKNSIVNRNKAAVIGLVIVLSIAVVSILNFNNGRIRKNIEQQPQNGGDLIIDKSTVTEQAKFYQYRAGGTIMEILAVKAPDGSIRTAFNTCQICYSSGRGFYEQVGDQLVCQNCGNRFGTEDVEVVRGGCNPVPIIKNDKVEDENRILIPEKLFDDYKIIFENWKSI